VQTFENLVLSCRSHAAAECFAFEFVFANYVGLEDNGD